MIKVQTLLQCGLSLSALLVMAACSGTQAGEPSPEPGAPETTGTQEPSQEPQGTGDARRDALIRQALENARRSMELRLFEDARNEAAFVLELDSTNQEARDILRRATEILGDRVPTVGGEFEDLILRDRIAAERDRFRAQKEMELGNAHLEQGNFGRAIEYFERAVTILDFSIHIQPNDPLLQRAEAALQAARAARDAAQAAELMAAQASSEEELQRMAREQRVAAQLKVQRLLEDANVQFQVGNYRAAVARVDQALLVDPTNPNALELRDLADRARHNANVELLRERWKQEWSKTFDELRNSNTPQTQVVKFDLSRWATVSLREPESFTPPAELESPETRAIIAKLRETRLEHNFASATVENWSSYYAGVTGVTFFVTPEVRDMDTEATTLTDFRLPTMSVHQALDVIKAQTGVGWRVRNGIVHLVSPENAIGTLYLAKYDVRDLVNGIRSKPGPDLKLKVPGDEDLLFGFEEDDPLPSVVDDGRLQDMIRNNIEPEKWDGSPFTMNYQSGVLLVRADELTQERIGSLLGDLRRHVGIQVDVESRFLKVEDNFLEDVGVDFRGLGDQSATGVPGRGLSTRPNAGFDDFGQSQQLNPADPGQIGTGSEPGIFFDDGLDGDYMARTENLFDRTLGGGEDGLTNAGGLSLQYAFLDDTEVEVVLRAVAKQERSQEIDAPRLLIYNNTRASMSFLRNISYIRDFEVEIAQAAAVANPVVDVVRDGVALDVRPVVDADLKFITMELRPTVMTLQLPIPTFTTTLGVGQPISIQLPRVNLQRVRTTVTMPDGGTMMLGGMKLVERTQQTSGVPLLKDLPIVSFLFSRKGTFTENKKILILIRAQIILMEEHEPLLLPTTPTLAASGGMR